MKLHHRMFAGVVLGALLAVVVPVWAMAQARSETISVQINLATPTGKPLIGTLVVQRTLGSDVRSNWSFNGMLDGKAARATGTAIEHWQGGGMLDVQLTAITTWEAPIPRPPLMTLGIVQTSIGMIFVQGVPLAISGKLQAPGSGSQTLIVMNAGRSVQPITQLPNTAGWSLFADPRLLVGLLVGGGAILIGMSRRLRSSRTSSSMWQA